MASPGLDHCASQSLPSPSKRASASPSKIGGLGRELKRTRDESPLVDHWLAANAIEELPSPPRPGGAAVALLATQP
eukprot:6374017-Prymnesium_polylepis.1